MEGHRVLRLEECRSGHEGIGTGLPAEAAAAFVDSAIDLKAEGEAEAFALGMDPGNGLEDFLVKGLPAETGKHRHGEHQVDRIKKGKDAVRRCIGVEREASPAVEPMDSGEGLTDVMIGLDVNDNLVGTGLGEGFDEILGSAQHQMGIDEESTLAAEGPAGLGPERKVWYKVSIHDIEVQPRGSGDLDEADGIGQGRMISGQDGGR